MEDHMAMIIIGHTSAGPSITITDEDEWKKNENYQFSGGW